MTTKHGKHRIKHLTARTADKYDLYLRSVQEPTAEIDFIDRVFRQTFKRKPTLLREDFCAAAAICCEWVRSAPGRRAVGYDLDPAPLKWGEEHNLSKLTEAERKRVALVQADVRDVSKEKAEVIAAENFSFFIFKTRDELRAYFKAAYANLAGKGLLVTDMMGGPDCFREDTKDVRKMKIEKGATFGIEPSKGVGANGSPVYSKNSFKYVWEQAAFNPINHHGTYHIHFRFKDGSELKRAFSYDWRLWTVPEIREVMLEAGFARADVYWEGPGKDGEGDGIYRKRETAASDDVWIAYVVGVKE